MSSIPAFQSALHGVKSGMQSMNNNSLKIANASSPQSNVNITEPLVGLLQDELQVKASAKAIEASNSMLGSILDIKV